MKIRYALVAAVVAAATASACSKLPTAADQHRTNVHASMDGTAPADSTNRGGGGMGSGN